MKNLTKKEFDYYFKNYTSILERVVHSSVLSRLKGKDICRDMEYEAMFSLINQYWHLAQDFRPVKYYRMWLRKELSCIDDTFEKIENNYKGEALQKVKTLHGKTLLSHVESAVGPKLEELRRGTSDYDFYKNMKEKGETILNMGGKEWKTRNIIINVI